MAHFVRTEGGGRSAYSKLDAEQCLDGLRVLPPALDLGKQQACRQRADLVQRQPSQTPRSEIAHTPAVLVHSGALEPGGSTRVEHAVWGSKSGESISETIQPVVKDSNRCPEGDLNPHAR